MFVARCRGSRKSSKRKSLKFSFSARRRSKKSIDEHGEGLAQRVEDPSIRKLDDEPNYDGRGARELGKGCAGVPNFLLVESESRQETVKVRDESGPSTTSRVAWTNVATGNSSVEPLVLTCDNLMVSHDQLRDDAVRSQR